MNSDKGNKKKDRLTPKEQHFVKKVSQNPGIDKEILVKEAGYNPKDRTNAVTMAGIMMKKPKIQRAIRDEIERLYPDALASNLQTLMELKDNPNVRPSDRIAAVKEINKMAGYQAPTRHERLSANIEVPKLPKE